MDSLEAVYSSLDACKGPPILMGENSSVEVTDKGRTKMTNGIFKNMLHVPKLSVNLLSIYQMINSSTRKKVIIKPNFVDIYDMQTNSRVSTDEVNHQSRLYTFFEFIELDYALLLTHADESSRIWHEGFGHLNFRYMQHLSKNILVDGLPYIHFSKGVCVITLICTRHAYLASGHLIFLIFQASTKQLFLKTPFLNTHTC
jgi:hypothetical protein